MEAAPRLPMISFALKVSTEAISFGPQLKKYIANFYNEDPESYNTEIYNLEGLRETAVRPTSDVAGCQTLKKYYCQLHFLKSRFPMEESQIAAVHFSWKDNHSNMACSVRDIRFELMCILYNIGALHSHLGASESRNSPEGMKMACTHFQCSAWAFQTVKEKYYQMATLHSSLELIHFMQQVCLAQAQECILEKSMLDNRKATIIAKVAVQVYDYYRKSLLVIQTCSDESNFHDLVGSKTYKEWVKYLQFKVTYHKSISLLFQGQQAEEQQKMGERVAFYQAACEQLEEARKLASQLKNLEIGEALAFTSDVVEGKRKAAKNENEFIYHEEVPDNNALQEVKGASLVKGIPFSVNDPEVSGTDLFARLVPMEAHEASSLYSEKKAQMLRQLGELVESKDQAVAEFMSSMQLDMLTKMRQASGIPQELVDRAAALSAKSTATQDLIEAMGKLSNIYHEVEAMLNEIDSLLKEEEQSEKEYQDIMGKRPPGIIANDLSREAAKYREAHTKANDSNQTLHRAMTAHVANLKILGTPLRQLHQQLPSIELPNPNIDENALKEMEALISKVDEMRTQRSMLWAQFREAVHKDDITGVLVTKQPNQSLEQLFQQELQKHQQLASLIEQNASAQENIKKALVESYANSLNTRRYVQDIIQKRSSTISALITSYDSYDDLLAKANKGIEFYTKLETNVTKLLQRIKSACKVQQEEREQMLLKSETPKTDLQTPATSSSGAPKLKDYLESRKKGATLPSTTSKYPDGSIQYPSVQYPHGSPEVQAWPPAVRPAPVGSDNNDPVGMSKSGSQEVYNYGANMQYAYPNSYSSQSGYSTNPSNYPPFSANQNGYSTSSQNQNYSYQAQNVQQYPQTTGYSPQIPYNHNVDSKVDKDLASRMNSLLSSKNEPTSNVTYQYNQQPIQYTYSNYIPQNYVPSNYNATSQQPYTSLPQSNSSQSIHYDTNKAYTTTTNTYQPISSHTPNIENVAMGYSHQEVNYPPSANNTSLTTNYSSGGQVDASNASNSVYMKYPEGSFTATGANNQNTGTYSNTYQYPSPATNYVGHSATIPVENTYYPPGYAPNYSAQNTTQGEYANAGYHTAEYATSVQSNLKNYNYNPTYSSPLASTSSSNTEGPNYMRTSSVEAEANAVGYSNYNNEQVTYNNQTSLPYGTATGQNQSDSYVQPQAGAYGSYSNYYGQNYNNPTPSSQNYNYSTSAAVPQQQIVTNQVPVTTTESNLDLLSGLDFTVNQAPLIPSQNTKTTEKDATKTVGEAAKVEPKSLTKEEAVNKPSAKSVPKILPSKPLNNSEVKKLFIQEVDKFEKYVDVLTNKTLSGPTNLDLKWKEIQDKQDSDGQKKIISVARCYPMKNRYPDILPYDFSRVELSDSKDDYINASFVKDVSPYAPTFLVTQAPLSSTFGDFWTMIREQQVELIFCLLNDNEIGEDVYWPKEKGKNLNVLNMVISLQSVIVKNNWTERLISVTIPEKRESLVVMHLQFTSWPGSLFPTTAEPFVSYITELITVYQQQRCLSHPVVVHCSSGIGRSGLVCLLTTAILDVSNNATSIPDLAVLALKLTNCKKNILRDREHLKFAYEAFLCYMKQITTQEKLKKKMNDVSQVPEESRTVIKEEANELVIDPLNSLDPFWASKKDL